MRKFNYIPIEKIKVNRSPAPKRSTNPGSLWNKLFHKMNVGDWFTVPAANHGAVGSSASQYVKGRYSLYKHPTLEDMYVFTITK